MEGVCYPISDAQQSKKIILNKSEGQLARSRLALPALRLNRHQSFSEARTMGGHWKTRSKRCILDGANRPTSIAVGQLGILTSRGHDRAEESHSVNGTTRWVRARYPRVRSSFLLDFCPQEASVFLNLDNKNQLELRIPLLVFSTWSQCTHLVWRTNSTVGTAGF